MFDATTPTTEAEAVSLMLSMIGENPITDLTAASWNPDVQNALMLLRAETRSLQTRQWKFNTDEKKTLTPALDGRIAVPNAASRIMPHVADDTPTMRDVSLTIRGEGGVLKVYDYKNSTFVWTIPIIVDIVYRYTFENLPEPVRWFLLVHAGRKFQMRFEGSESRYKLGQEDELEARQGLVDYEITDANPNFLNDSGDVVEGWAH